jgi:hypothetical protein
MSGSSNSKNQGRVGIIEAVTSPLGFFTLMVLAIEVILSITINSFDLPGRRVIAWFMMSLLVLLVVAVVILTIYKPEALLGNQKEKLSISDQQKKSSSDIEEKIPMIFENSDSTDFSSIFEELFCRAQRIVMIGTGFNILQRDPIRKLLNKRLKENCQVEIYAANPFSPNVQARLIEEEIGDPRPRIRKVGLVNWLQDLLEVKNKLVDKEKLTLRLFPFYPTYALFVFDDQDYFFYPYGYTQLGTLSPVMHYSKKNASNSATIYFFDSQYQRVKEHSADAELVFKLYEGKRIQPEYLTAFAVYLVPPAYSTLYKLGSEILGYDIRNRSQLQHWKWYTAVGPAADFGFHLTVADALYCAHPKDIDLISEEIAFLAQEFPSFSLNFTLEQDFPNSQGIALVCHDESGSLEALHHEMVARIYRKAVASNYSLGLAQPNRDSDRKRAKLMIERYHAPYILQRFKPHFSLLSDVPADKKEQIYQDVKKLYEKYITEPSIEISSIAIMFRPISTEPWRILNEYNLQGGRI